MSVGQVVTGTQDAGAETKPGTVSEDGVSSGRSMQEQRWC